MQIWQFASLLQPYLHLRKLSTKKELFQSDIVCICAICIVSSYSLWWPAQLLNKYLFGQKGCAELTCIHVRAGMDGLCNFIILFILLVKWSYCKWGASWKYKSVHNLDVTQPKTWYITLTCSDGFETANEWFFLIFLDQEMLK